MIEFVKLDLSRIQAIALSSEQIHIIFTNKHQILSIESIPVPPQVIECFRALSEGNNRKTVTLPCFTPPTPMSLSPEAIEMVEVSALKAGHSDTIKAIGYDPKREILQVHFNSDAVYQYHQVPYDGFLNFLTSDSLGSFFNQFINNRFEAVRVK
jgi:KTSC domain